MTITKIRVIRPKDRTSPVLAFADVELDGSVTLRDMRLLKSSEPGGEPWLKMPTKQTKAGTYQDVYNPINVETRKAMTAAVVSCLQLAIEADKNEMEMETGAEAAEPVFSGVRVRRFQNNREMRALVSVLVDESVALNRIAILLDEETKALKLSMPNHDIGTSGAFISYFRTTPGAYQKLYKTIMEAYSAPPSEGDAA